MPLLKAQEPASFFYFPLLPPPFSFPSRMPNLITFTIPAATTGHQPSLPSTLTPLQFICYKAARVRFFKKYLISPHSPIHNSWVISIKISYEVFKAIPNLEPTSSPITHFPPYYRAPTTLDYCSPSVRQLGSCFLACALSSPTT